MMRLPSSWKRLQDQQEVERKQRLRIASTVRGRIAVLTDAVASAKAAGLRHVDPSRLPGIRRIGAKTRRRYVGPEGRTIADRNELDRIAALVIPPAWTDVWICPQANGHLQATGRDARGRLQYRYHTLWRAVRDEVKYGRMLAFAAALPRIRTRTAEDIARAGLPRAKVLATIVALLEKTLIRVGNEEYARHNGSVGLTTMRDAHAVVNGGTLRFVFRGKSGVSHEIGLADRRLARIVRACRDLPGHELFQYIDASGVRHSIDSADVNAYVRECCRDDFTAKDFRTWAGTVLAARALADAGPAASPAAAKREINAAVAAVAERLGNTKAVCRKSYIHPMVIDAYMRGITIGPSKKRAAASRGLTSEELAVVRLLSRGLRKSA